MNLHSFSAATTADVAFREMANGPLRSINAATFESPSERTARYALHRAMAS